MQPQSLAEALASKIIMVKDDKKVVKKTLPENIYVGIRNKTSDFILAPVDFQEYFDLVCCLINYSLSPSPPSISDSISAAAVLTDSTNLDGIKRLLSSNETHAIKLLDTNLAGSGFVNQIPKSSSDSYGLSTDTLEAPTVLNLGTNASDQNFSPFWLCSFKFPWGEVSDHLSIFMRKRGSDAHIWIADALSKLGAANFSSELDRLATALSSKPLPGNVVGKMVRFPLSDDACATDHYINISPVPSATMVYEFKKRYFDAIKKYKKDQAAEIKSPVFEYPSTANISVGGKMAQNSGSAALAVNGFAKGFKGFIPSLSLIDGRKNGRLIASLQSGSRSIISVDRFTSDFLQKQPSTSVLRKNWEANLSEVLADLLEGLVSLRENGIPAEVTVSRFGFAIERDFICKLLDGDKNGRSLTPNDLHLLGLHVRDQIQYQIVKRTKGLGLDYDRQEKIYSVVVSLLR